MAATMQDLERVAFVTRRFDQLKGLHSAANGAALLAGALITQSLAAASGFSSQPFQVFLFANLSIGFGSIELDRRYSETFGRAPVRRWSDQLGTLLMTPFFPTITGALIDLAYSQHQWPSGAAVGLAMMSAAVLVRDGRWRVHYLAPFAAAMIAIAMTASVAPAAYPRPYEIDPLRAPVFVLAYAIIGFGMVVAGLLDHHLLGRMLHRDSVASESSAPRGPRTAVLQLIVSIPVAVSALVALQFKPVLIPIVLTMTLALAFLGIIMLRSATHAVNVWRKKGVPPFVVHRHSIAMWIVAAVAAVADTAQLAPGPLLTTMAFGACSLRIAIREWRTRKHYLLGVAAAVIVVVMMPRLAPAQTCAVFLLACAGALAIEALCDYYLAERGLENAHADTI